MRTDPHTIHTHAHIDRNTRTDTQAGAWRKLPLWRLPVCKFTPSTLGQTTIGDSHIGAEQQIANKMPLIDSVVTDIVNSVIYKYNFNFINTSINDLSKVGVNPIIIVYILSKCK